MIGIAMLVAIGCLILPIVAIVRVRKIRDLEQRLAGVEAALLRLMRPPVATEAPPAVDVPSVHEEPPAAPATMLPPPLPSPSEQLETIIGRRWLALVAIALIFGATVFFLKYAFENGWIGELGRVALGVAAGLTLTGIGLERHRKGWRYFSQILTGGGITILYLSIYGAFAYYHLIDQRSAFAVLAIVVAEAHLLAVAYDAPAIAVLALVGGFLVPLLLSTGRDQYRVLFTYIGLLDLATLGVVLARRWRWIGSMAYIGTLVLFWSWHAEHYHPEKRLAALFFQSVILVIFMLADLAPNLRRTAAGWEELVRLVVNPLVFYATCYSLLNSDHHDWMAVLALVLAIVYAALARFELTLSPVDRRALLVILGTALVFVTLAIPVQLESNWITIAWGMEAVILIWASYEAPAPQLRMLAIAVFSLAGFRFLAEDTPWNHRAMFTPVFNRCFLGMLVLAACLAAAAYLYKRAGGTRAVLVFSLLAVAVVWLGSSVETYSYFGVRVDRLITGRAEPDNVETIRQLRWGGQLGLSLLWTAYAGLLSAAGFRWRRRAVRIAGLTVFAVTLVKVVFVDIPELRQFYRIIALLGLGLVLLGAAWAYQRIPRREASQ